MYRYIVYLYIILCIKHTVTLCCSNTHTMLFKNLGAEDTEDASTALLKKPLHCVYRHGCIYIYNVVSRLRK